MSVWANDARVHAGELEAAAHRGTKEAQVREYFTDIVSGDEKVTLNASDFDALRDENHIFRAALEEIAQRRGEAAHNPGLRAQRALDSGAGSEPDHPVASADRPSSARPAPGCTCGRHAPPSAHDPSCPSRSDA